MDFTRKRDLIDQQIKDASNGTPANFDEWQNKTDVVLRSIFGETGAIYKKFTDIRYSPSFYTDSTDFAPYLVRGVQEAISLMQAGKLELEITAEAAPISADPAPASSPPSTRIFIVHGHDDSKKYELESYLQKLVGEPPVILHQEPSGGKVLIEKLEDSSTSIGYAVVLLTADDLGRPKELDPEDERGRARQNVVFEMGFFFGLIGRSRVAVLFDEGVEHPSDIAGLVYIPLDSAGAWKPKLASEINHAGIEVDWSAIARS
jgi:predicted nucleotide-binding protein